MKRFFPLFISLGIIGIIFGLYVLFTHLGMPTKLTRVAGFWDGLWQGAIVVLTFIASWFDKNVTLYQVGNNGFWYNFGFIIGLSAALGGGGHASHRQHHKNK